MQKQILTLLASLTLVAATGFGADSLVGKWNFDPEKSHLTGLQYKIEDAGGGHYRFVFGEDVETLTLDGKEIQTKFGDNWSVKATGPDTWESVTKRDGKVTARSKWTISKDGKTFTSIDQSMRPDGSLGHSQAILKRTAGTSGLAGTWESTSVKVMSPMAIEITNWQGDGYSLISPTFKQHLDFKIDGKSYTPTGPRVANGTTVIAKKAKDHDLQLTYKLKGKTTETDNWKVSADGKTLTQTITYPGVSKPEVDVYNRE